MSLSNHSSQFAHQETACHLLLKELQKIWDDVGESDSQKDAMLLEIEQKCLELYKKKVDEAKAYRAQIQQEITDYEAEIAGICAAMGVQPPHFERKTCESLKKGREIVVLQLEEMRKLKTERKKQFLEVLYQLQNISTELYGSKGANVYLDENNLTLESLEELQKKLVQFQNEKASRLKQVSDLLNTLSSLCSVLGLDIKDKLGEICPTMVTSTATKEISDNTIKILSSEVKSLREVKSHRMQKLQCLATGLLEMWNLMGTPHEEQQKFHSFTNKIAALESEFTEPNMLSIDSVIYVEAEVRRLKQLKSTKMKELVLRKKLELEEICKSSHLIAETVFPSEHPSESINYEHMFQQVEHQIEMAKEEAVSRKEILEKVEKWLAACQEESWLEEYNRDDNRYNAGRGAHLALKRAEKARAISSKIPGMVEALILKVKSWEKERGIEFLYEGSRLCSMLEDYSALRQEKENEKQRQRDQKKLKGQIIAEHESLFGSKPSPSNSGLKASLCSTGVASFRKLSMGGAMLQDSRQSAIFEPSNKKGILSTPKGIPCIRNASHARKDTPKGVGKSVKKTPYTAEKQIGFQSPLIRKPLSPISSSFMSKANIPTNFEEDHRKSEMHLKSQMLTSTSPSKPILVGDEDNLIPKNIGLAVPTTPLTSVPMLLTANTPDTPSATMCSNSGSNVARKIAQAQPFEYSFEELRAGFVLPKKTFA
ncbi:65-kDa microtubule-associated protein 4-like [Arachis stenosperma]|uniref:65-kDa microtubule-associated protein 4-like n=1 Tax=Arachis stenosperma TaxID=217475 RepID=UPI0025AC9497|nr:65-kDa microtubule-associated protein 4-like [Arachis stenosperma]